MKHLERSKKFSFKFPVPLCLDIFGIEPDLLIKYIALKLYSLVISPLLKVLGVQKILIVNIHQFS